MTKIEEREKAIRKIWAANALMQVLKLEIEEIQEGRATLSMPIDFEIHTNHWLGVHGGALATLADSACGIACASAGKIAQTLNMNINYISNTRSMNKVFATAEIVHDGQSTVNLRVTIKDDVETMMCDASAVYFVSGSLDDMKV